MRSLPLALLALLPAKSRAQTYSATYLPSNAPDHSEQGQAGTNRCAANFNQSFNCQNAYIIQSTPSPTGPIPSTSSFSSHTITFQNGTGTRLIPDGAITGAHFVQTPDFVQVTGTFSPSPHFTSSHTHARTPTGAGNLTFINIPAGDEGSPNKSPTHLILTSSLLSSSTLCNSSTHTDKTGTVRLPSPFPSRNPTSRTNTIPLFPHTRTHRQPHRRPRILHRLRTARADLRVDTYIRYARMRMEYAG
ncbi:hypothetical protein C0995_003493 [Termitomyces sp. Mi166|nr:hypothetical protein C0995_003493 [Termitomyces sp. Mi166\